MSLIELGDTVEFSCSMVQPRIAASLDINRQQLQRTNLGKLFDQEVLYEHQFDIGLVCITSTQTPLMTTNI